MSVFVDTSALYSVMDRNDQNHLRAVSAWERILDENTILFTTNYVLLETFTLLQNRLGMDAARDFHRLIVPILSIIWVEDAQHARAAEAFLAADERRLSLVDCSSFIACRDTGTNHVFAYDRHFERAGFQLLV